MNALIRTITLLAVVNLIIVGTLQAQNVSDEEIQRALAAKEAEIAQKQAEAAQKQVQAAQREMETAQRQMEVEQRQIELAALLAQTQASTPAAAPEAPAPPRPVSVQSISFNQAWPSPFGAAPSVLVIPSDEFKIEDLVAMTEDMNVMSRIFEKNLEQAHIALVGSGGLLLDSRYGLSAMLGRGRQTTQGMYLQGYGALFLMKVDFPLSPPPQVEEEPETKKDQESDPVWEQMRRQMYEPQEATKRRAKEPQAKYDAEKVENLKTTLVKALKHAANIRGLKPDESVVLTIAGSVEVYGTKISVAGRPPRGSQVVVQEKDAEGNKTTRIVEASSLDGTRLSSPAILVIRAKKSDIDAFAKNADYEQFRRRTQVLSCPYLVGAEAAGGDPFSLY